MNKLLVIGSINVDFFITTEKLPIIGETILGENFTIFPGGKGANQAIAAAKMEADVSFMGCVGDDIYGQAMIDNLKQYNINTSRIKKIKNTNTGTAFITSIHNDNSIIVIKGANASVTSTFIDENETYFDNFNMVLIQNEIPQDAIEKIIQICNKKNIPIIYNPAPFKDFTKNLVSQVSLLTPNEIEAKNLSSNKDNIITTLGEKGVLYKEKIIKAKKVKTIDTTGAGDTFSGTLCAFLLKGYTIEEAINQANTAASLAVTKNGAQNAIPTLKDLNLTPSKHSK